MFDFYFEQIYTDRWPKLLNALKASPHRFARDCFQGHAEYTMDAASIRAAQALQVNAQDRVLDMCAAPGGKSLILLESRPKLLVANEMSFARRKRLVEVLKNHVPSQYHPLFKITGYDGNRFGLKTPDEFDRVLLDAPCSSERHLIEQGMLGEWKESRTKQLAKRQYSLLCSAILATKPGGTIVYSTCSISPLENDGVIERVIERKADQVQVDAETQDLSDLERTRFGFQIFPDRSGGEGPMYICRLKRI